MITSRAGNQRAFNASPFGALGLVSGRSTLAERLGSPAAALRRPWSAAATAHRPPVGIASTPRGGHHAESPVTADSPAAKLARLEAVLFLAREPFSTRKLAELADLADGAEARVLVRELGRRLKRRRSAMAPVEVAHGVLLMTRPQLADWMGKLHGCGQDLRLTAPALETLAVVAYRQPTTRADVEAIRGVQCGEMLRVLMERDLLRIVGRSEELGRPFLYGTTRRFLQVFGLGRLEQLPPVDQIRNAATPPARAA
jgi:segregation and condensation protein B